MEKSISEAGTTGVGESVDLSHPLDSWTTLTGEEDEFEYDYSYNKSIVEQDFAVWKGWLDWNGRG